MHVSKIAKLKNSIFPEQENALHAYRVQELYVETKWGRTTNAFTSQQQTFIIFL